ncbi:MAG: c-type cytochrome [Hyphomicrobiales bacterium]|nr:c-type cytochrome [Hyphomicrobiales bacterium]
MGGAANGANACSACHGDQGEGRPEAGFPRLAGLNPDYIVQQLNDLASGARANETMTPIAKALSPAERTALGAYLAGLQPPAAPVEPKPEEKVVAEGKKIALQGLWDKDLPQCVSCHGAGGVGVGVNFPKLAGQSAQYIANQLDAWKTGKRTNDPLHLMTGVASKLDDSQIAAVAAYFESLSPVAAGGAQ